MTEARSLSKSCGSKLAVGNAQEPKPEGKCPTRNRRSNARIAALTAGVGALAAAALTAAAPAAYDLVTGVGTINASSFVYELAGR
jgi:hypothetical protein